MRERLCPGRERPYGRFVGTGGLDSFAFDNADAWVIFPYEIIDGRAREIGWREFAGRFPKTGAYLEERKRKLRRRRSRANRGSSRWHLYTRPQNLVSQARPKAPPMTIEDAMAVVAQTWRYYEDNVNIQFDFL